MPASSQYQIYLQQYCPLRSHILCRSFLLWLHICLCFLYISSKCDTERKSYPSSPNKDSLTEEFYSYCYLFSPKGYKLLLDYRLSKCDLWTNSAVITLGSRCPPSTPTQVRRPNMSSRAPLCTVTFWKHQCNFCPYQYKSPNCGCNVQFPSPFAIFCLPYLFSVGVLAQ